MRQETINIYTFKELDTEIQQKIIERYYENEDYPFLSADLTDSCKYLLENEGIEYADLNLHYSLNYNQGDGLCFEGIFNYKNYILTAKHSTLRYYHSLSTNISIEQEQEQEQEQELAETNAVLDEFKVIYLDICDKLEKEGYSILNYRMNIPEFGDSEESKFCEFLKNGDEYHNQF